MAKRKTTPKADTPVDKKVDDVIQTTAESTSEESTSEDAKAPESSLTTYGVDNALIKQMKSYTGTKNIKAVLITRGAYNKYRGWDIPSNEDPKEPVYLVEYEADPSNKSNHPDHAGYISMSPKEVFEKAYRSSDTFLDRLHIEKDELDLKIAKLKAGLSSGKVPKSEVAILNLQLNTMQHYSKILETRINNAA